MLWLLMGVQAAHAVAARSPPTGNGTLAPGTLPVVRAARGDPDDVTDVFWPRINVNDNTNACEGDGVAIATAAACEAVADRVGVA